jgi:FdhD protein
MRNISIATIKMTKVSSHHLLQAQDELAVEEPLEIQLLYGAENKPIHKAISVTMRTPGQDKELALGFLLTEGIIQDPSQVAETYGEPAENKVLVKLHEGVAPLLQKSERNFYTTSSCGVCGKTSIDAIKTVSRYNNMADDLRVKASMFYGLEEALRKKQALFASTGGLHASALFDLEGNLLLLREDVGRHNALDKVIGSAFLNQDLPLDHQVLLLSGRASFELVQKAAMAGIKIVAAVGAPSSLAVELAADTGITLIGFLRSNGFNIYSGAHRITHSKT